MSTVICTTPRTGGTWLAQQLGFSLPCELIRVGVRRQLPQLGYPHGRPAQIRKWATLHGIKVHADQIGAFHWLPNLEDALPLKPEYVLLTRDDREAQARSILTAQQTGDWQTPHQPYGEFPESEVAAVVKLVGKWEAGWHGWFEERGITPSHVTYEQLVGK